MLVLETISRQLNCNLLDYVDDCLYFGKNNIMVKLFEEEISLRFDLKLLGQAHWYLSTLILPLISRVIVYLFCESI